MAEKVCKNCLRMVKGDECAICRSKDLSENWKGVVEIFNPDSSEIAKIMNAKMPGRYALRVK